MKIHAPSQRAAVHYRVSVIENGREVDGLARKRNLILDAGLNKVASVYWANCFSRAVVGTGTTPVKRDSGATTFTRAGNVVTADAAFFEAADVGRLLKFDTGEEMYITVYTDAQTVTVGTSGALAASEGTVWYVNQTALTTEVKRSNTYGTDSGDNGTTFTADTMTMKRTIIFSAETGTVNYREIGWSDTSTAGANLFGRDLLAGGGVVLVAGQQLKVVVELSVMLAPATAVAWANVITGWTQDGQQRAEGFALAIVTSSGSTDANGLTVGLEPSTVGAVALSTTAVALNAPNTQGYSNFSGQVVGKNLAFTGSYVNGSFSRSKSATFLVTEGNSTAIRSIVLKPDSNVLSAYRVLLNAAETKDSNHTLTIGFTSTWGRTLQN